MRKKPAVKIEMQGILKQLSDLKIICIFRMRSEFITKKNITSFNMKSKSGLLTKKNPAFKHQKTSEMN